MALGPKAMGEAIAANLRASTGKTLEEWLAALDARAPKSSASAAAWLKDRGLGHFQAQLTVRKWKGEPMYDDPEQIVADLFRDRPDQRRLYEAIVDQVATRLGATVNPCKGYVPLYSRSHRIFASFRPTRDGLYIGLIGDAFDVPVTPHRPSLGGSERMSYGCVCHDVATGVRVVEQSCRNDENGE